MNLAHLRTFLTIVETGSLVRASEKLHVTQSTVTTRLKALEQELAQTLINRQKSGITLTAAGGRLRRYAQTIDELWRQAKQETALPDEIQSVCNIGCDPDLWPFFGKALFDHIRGEFPQVAISVWHAGADELTNWLNAGLIDVSLTYKPVARNNQSIQALLSDQLILVSTDPNAPLRFDPNYIFVEAGEDFGRQHAKAFADANTAKYSFGSAVLGLAHILENGGSAYLPKRLALKHLSAERLYKLERAPEFQRRSYAVINTNATRDWHWLKDAFARLEV